MINKKIILLLIAHLFITCNSYGMSNEFKDKLSRLKIEDFNDSQKAQRLRDEIANIAKEKRGYFLFSQFAHPDKNNLDVTVAGKIQAMANEAYQKKEITETEVPTLHDFTLQKLHEKKQRCIGQSAYLKNYYFPVLTSYTIDSIKSRTIQRLVASSFRLLTKQVLPIEFTASDLVALKNNHQEYREELLQRTDNTYNKAQKLLDKALQKG